jgi:hypothetical protein
MERATLVEGKKSRVSIKRAVAVLLATLAVSTGLGSTAVRAEAVQTARPDSSITSGVPAQTGCYYSYSARRYYCYGNQGGGYSPSYNQRTYGGGYYYGNSSGSVYTPNYGRYYSPYTSRYKSYSPYYAPSYGRYYGR